MLNNLLWVGRDAGYETAKLSVLRAQGLQASFHFADQVIKALPIIDSRNCSGVYLDTLNLYFGVDTLKFDLTHTEKRFSHGSGLYLARYACSRAIPVLVNAKNALEQRHAREVGADVVLSCIDSKAYFDQLVSKLKILSGQIDGSR